MTKTIFACAQCEGSGSQTYQGHEIECTGCGGTGVDGPEVGDFVREILVTDTIVYEVVAKTPKTITVRRALRGETVKSENRDGHPLPVVWTEAISDTDPEAKKYLVRLRKDGTYRLGNNPLRPATVIEGKPVFYTDYRE